jgi:hypothetical protein
MNSIWEVVFTKLVAKNTLEKAELQRLVNLEGSVGETAIMIEDILKEMVMTETLLNRWQELKAQSIAQLTQTEENGEVE